MLFILLTLNAIFNNIQLVNSIKYCMAFSLPCLDRQSFHVEIQVPLSLWQLSFCIVKKFTTNFQLSFFFSIYVMYVVEDNVYCANACLREQFKEYWKVILHLCRKNLKLIQTWKYIDHL